jgi:hypothetical protein
MSNRNKLGRDNLTEKILAVETDDPIVDSLTAAALENFKTSLNAWSEAVRSEAAYSRPRAAVRAVGRAGASWRLAATWMIVCMFAVGSLAGGLYERHQRQAQARIAALKAAEQESAAQQKATQKLDLTNNAPEQRVAAAIVVTRRQPTAVKSAAANDAELLATVDSDVSRQVPAAMEPLAQMMDSSGTN